MINQERVGYCLGETALHHQSQFEKVQVNLEWGPLVKDSLAAFKHHFEQLTSSGALVVGYRFTIQFHDVSQEFTKEQVAKIGFAQILRKLDEHADKQTESSDFWREARKNDGIRCFWSNFGRSDGSGTAKIYVVATGNQIHGQDDVEAFRKDVLTSLWSSCVLSRDEISGLNEQCSFATSFALKSSMTLITPQDENYEMLKGLLFYKLSALTAIPIDIKNDDLVSSSVLI
ncbi:hypothetical protein [Photobacterium lutimaris]|uniref:Uncharacterized protein n=1 Tax=Photobacterium lutimaris TaxID=388278 RepID=A0A2T3II11_9GAMM|nr:hypothetical protein [Photobacterium lutimaris]PSU27962.1 hypothetical protein C9I99_26590 [Photobacterium lutimaris]TDR69960.1 hypothetical protein DFP78_12514 [Photobacterium lutimaris]